MARRGAGYGPAVQGGETQMTPVREGCGAEEMMPGQSAVSQLIYGGLSPLGGQSLALHIHAVHQPYPVSWLGPNSCWPSHRLGVSTCGPDDGWVGRPAILKRRKSPLLQVYSPRWCCSRPGKSVESQTARKSYKLDSTRDYLSEDPMWPLRGHLSLVPPIPEGHGREKFTLCCEYALWNSFLGQIGTTLAFH